MAETATQWKATAGRITLFPTAAGSRQDAPALFSKVFGVEPERSDKQGAGGTHSNAAGIIADLGASCSVSPVRIDITLTPPLAMSAFPKQQIPLVEDVGKLKEMLLNCIEPISRLADQILCTRVAYFLQLTQLVGSVEEGNALVSQTMPESVRLGLTNEYDFIFQINRPRASKHIKGTDLNFLTRWSVDHVKLFALSAGLELGSVVMQGQDALISSHTVANIVIDNNSKPIDTPFDEGSVATLLRECIEAAPRDNGLNLKVPGL